MHPSHAVMPIRHAVCLCRRFDQRRLGGFEVPIDRVGLVGTGRPGGASTDGQCQPGQAAARAVGGTSVALAPHGLTQVRTAADGCHPSDKSITWTFASRRLTRRQVNDWPDFGCVQHIHRQPASGHRRKTLQVPDPQMDVTHRMSSGQDTKVTVQQALGLDEPPARLRLAHVMLFHFQLPSRSSSIGEQP